MDHIFDVRIVKLTLRAEIKKWGESLRERKGKNEVSTQSSVWCGWMKGRLARKAGIERFIGEGNETSSARRIRGHRHFLRLQYFHNSVTKNYIYRNNTSLNHITPVFAIFFLLHIFPCFFHFARNQYRLNPSLYQPWSACVSLTSLPSKDGLPINRS